MRVPRAKEIVRGPERLGWINAVLAIGLITLVVGASAAGTVASVGPTCSASAVRNERTLREGSYARYCGPGRAVLRVDGKVFVIKGGTCRRGMGSVGFGLNGYSGGQARGIWLRLQPEGSDAIPPWNIRAGRNKVIDGEVQLPGFASLPHTGTAIVAKDLKSATFSLGRQAKPKITGSRTCA
jgi:hypothetical protein